MLYNLQKYKSTPNIQYVVVSLSSKGGMIQKYIEEGFDFVLVDLKKEPLKSFKQLITIVKSSDVVSCWMYHSNFIGYIVNKFAKCKKLIWNIRNTDISRKKNSRSMFFCNYFCKKWSKNVDLITYNGEVSYQEHLIYGYTNKNYVILNNGCDTDLFNAKFCNDSLIREELNIPADKKIVLSVGRYNVLKDIPNFIYALAQNKGKHNFVGVMCGRNIDVKNKELINLIKTSNLKIKEDVLLLGERSDINRIMASSYVYVMHSQSEAFSNTLIQAMSCAIPVISTDAGVSRDVMVNKDLVSHVGDYVGLANNLDKVLSFDSKQIEQEKINNRNRIVENYDIRNIVKQYEKIYLNV